MNSTAIGFLLWSLVALGAWVWSRPSGTERAALARAPRGVGRRLFRPLSSVWRTGVAAADLEPLAALRSRTQRALLVLFVPLLMVPFALGDGDGDTQPEPLPSPQPTAQRVVVDSTVAPPSRPPPKPIVRKVVKVEEEPASNEERAVNTVRAGDEDALEANRTHTRLFGDARIGAMYDNEKLLGIRIRGIEPGSFWETLGVEENDVVLELNGRLMDNPAASVFLINALASEYVLIMRVQGEDGVARTLEYRTPED